MCYIFNLTKNFSISFSEWVFNTYLASYKGNRSAFIEGLFVKGFEIESGELDSQKLKLIELTKKNKELEIELSKREAQLSRYKTNKLTEIEKFAKSYKNRGLMG